MTHILKLSLLGLIFSLLISGQAFANSASWGANAQVYVKRDEVRATIVNQFNRPIVCSGYVYGETYSGVVLNSWVNNKVIWPRNYYTVYVHSNYRDSFTDGWSEVECRVQ